MVLFQTIQFFHMLKAPVLGRNQELGVCVCVLGPGSRGKPRFSQGAHGKHYLCWDGEEAIQVRGARRRSTTF